MDSWNRVSMMSQDKASSQAEIWTDALGSYECGAIAPYLHQCIQLWWPLHNHTDFKPRDQSILWKELVPIVIACAVWAKHWRGLRVTVHCDNMGTVAVVNAGYSREHNIIHLLRCLFFIRATYQFSLYATHIAGAQNGWADG